MQFNVNEWRNTYDKVQCLGQIIKDSQPRMTEKKEWVPAVQEISKEAFDSIEKEIKSLLKWNTSYLNGCGVRPNPPLWKYDNRDPTTWPSDVSFKYGHLLRFEGYQGK